MVKASSLIKIVSLLTMVQKSKKERESDEFTVGAGLLAAAGVLLGGAIAGGLMLSSQNQPPAATIPTNETQLRQAIKRNISTILECNVRLKDEEYLILPPYSQYGKGDLLYEAMWSNTIFVVEVKYLNHNSKNKQNLKNKKKELESQTKKYGNLNASKFTNFKIKSIGVINGVDGNPKIHCRFNH